MAPEAHRQSPEPEEPSERALERLNRFQEREARAAIADLGLAPGSRGLDVGCGVGLWALWLAEAVGPGGRVLGIERAPERVEAARRLVGARAAGRIEFRQGDAPALDAAGGTFDWDYLKPQSRDGRRRTGRAVVGGLPAKPGIAALTAEQVAARARQAIAELQGRGLLLGPDCSINPDTPEALLRAAGAVRG